MSAVPRPPSPPDVILEVPVGLEFLVVSRLVASGVGSVPGFTLEEIDEIKTAVDEGCALLGSERAPDDHLVLAFYLLDDEMVVEISAPEGPSVMPDELVVSILEAMVDDHEVDVNSDRPALRFRKRRRSG